MRMRMMPTMIRTAKMPRTMPTTTSEPSSTTFAGSAFVLVRRGRNQRVRETIVVVGMDMSRS